MKKTFCAFLILACLSALLVPAKATEDNLASAQSVVETYISSLERSGTITLGYYNTVTGEEYYLDGDKYMQTASVYKLPLSMYWSDWLTENNQSWAEPLLWGQSAQNVIHDTIALSSNDYGFGLQNAIGDQIAYRTAVAPYYGINCNDSSVGDEYYKTSNATAKMVIYTLKKLYDNSGQYPQILEFMKEASPERYFCLKENCYIIAHKYGYLDGDLCTINDCGIIYTDNPFLLVVFTYGTSHGEEVIADLCSLLCDYTQQNAIENANTTCTPDPTVEPTLVPSTSPIITASPEPISIKNESKSMDYVIIGLAILGLIIFPIIIHKMIKDKKRKDSNYE